MLTYVLRRILQTIPVLIGVTMFVFLLMHLTPGDPAQMLAGENASPEQVEQMRIKLGLNEPIIIQYTIYISNALQGDLGNSLRSGRAVTEELSGRFGVTVQLALASMFISIVVGMTAGILAASKAHSLSDFGMMIVALIGLSIPNVWLGLILIYFLSIQFPIFPVSGWGTWQHLILPAITLGTAGAAMIARQTRSSMLEVLGQDYIRTAQAKGLHRRVVMYKHALKNALIPVITVIGLQIGGLLGGAVLTEQVFAINGMGRLLIEAINARDFPIVQGTVLIVALLFVLMNLVVDISYHMLNKNIELR